ncbi:hypothetical protein BD560DRAFT_389450 [Blakeslea trispora]|nr:hypothetical protein BD560DRAFT_389450 [Blakeslea trispora]
MKLSLVLALTFCVALVSAGKHGHKRKHYQDNRIYHHNEKQQSVKNVGNTKQGGGILSNLVNVDILTHKSNTNKISQNMEH